MRLAVQDFALIIEALRGPGSAGGGGSEKRKAVRMTVTTKLEVHLSRDDNRTFKSFSVLSRDVSLTGVGLMQSVGLPKEAKFVLTLPRAGRAALHVVCKVMYTQMLADGLFGIGAEYEEMASDEIVKLIEGDDQEQTRRVREAMLQ
jgi:hypothetical protein